MSETVAIRPERPGQSEVRALLDASEALMARLYPAESSHIASAEALATRDVLFLVARLGPRAVGCVAALPAGGGDFEIKRMFVDPEARGRGVGRSLLAAIERSAAEQGARRLLLEAGVRQPAALALYRSAGFADIPPFGSYQEDPLSVFMAKPLGSDAHRPDNAKGPSCPNARST